MEVFQICGWFEIAAKLSHLENLNGNNLSFSVVFDKVELSVARIVMISFIVIFGEGIVRMVGLFGRISLSSTNLEHDQIIPEPLIAILKEILLYRHCVL